MNTAQLLKSYFYPITMEAFASQQLTRRPEPAAVTSAAENVYQYDQVMTSPLAINYALAIEVIFRTRVSPSSGPTKALDLCCGPGHLSLAMAKQLGIDHLTGIDLSEGMVQVAQKNAASLGLANNVHFKVGDVLDLSSIESNSHDLTTFSDAAHHMPSLKSVRQVLEEMDRITKTDGLVMLMDLARFSSEYATEAYVNLLGAQIKRQGMPDFFQDFRNSMYAAWNTTEMRSAIPKQSSRVWYHFYPRLLPFVQFIVGVPAGGLKPLQRSELPWKSEAPPVPESMLMEWRMARLALRLGVFDRLSPGE